MLILSCVNLKICVNLKSYVSVKIKICVNLKSYVSIKIKICVNLKSYVSIKIKSWVNLKSYVSIKIKSCVNLKSYVSIKIKSCVNLKSCVSTKTSVNVITTASSWTNLSREPELSERNYSNSFMFTPICLTLNPSYMFWKIPCPTPNLISYKLFYKFHNLGVQKL